MQWFNPIKYEGGGRSKKTSKFDLVWFGLVWFGLVGLARFGCGVGGGGGGGGGGAWTPVCAPDEAREA